MAHKIINRIPSDGWLIGAVAIVAFLSFGTGWLLGGNRGDDPMQVEVVQTKPRPLTDALLKEFDKIDAAVSVGINMPNFQASLRDLTRHYQGWTRSAEPDGIPAEARAALESAYADCLYISKVWRLKRKMIMRENKRYDPKEAPTFEVLFGKEMTKRYGIDQVTEGEDDWTKLVQIQMSGIGGRTESGSDFAMLFLRAAMSHASEGIDAARAALR